MKFSRDSFKEKQKILVDKAGYFLTKRLPKPKPIKLGDGTVVQPPRSAKLYISILLIILIYYFGQITDFQLSILIRNFPNIFEFMARIFNPDFSYFSTVIGKVLETIRMALLGTFIGSILALPVSFVISSNLNKNARFLIPLIKTILSLLRTFPMLIYASIIKLMFSTGSGPLVGTIAIAIFSFSILSKMMYEHIETLDLGAFEAIESSGVTKIKAFIVAILPEILPVYYSYALYSFDINVRHSTILGYVGAGGIGVLLKTTLQSDNYEQASTILLGIFIVVILIESVSKYLRKRLA